MNGIMLRRSLLVLAGLVLTFSFGTSRAQAQESWDDPTFSSFTQAMLVSGFTFTINNVNVTNASQVGANGDYVFGFSSTNTPIVINFGSAANDPFGGNGTENITGIDAVYLVSNGPQDGKNAITAALNSNGAPVSDYNGGPNPPNWAGGPAPGANFPSYQAGDFGSSNYLREGSGTDPATGDFSFTNIAQSSTATGSILFGFHMRNTNGTTAFVLFDPAPVPEPGYVQLGGLLAMGGLGSAFQFLKKRRIA